MVKINMLPGIKEALDNYKLPEQLIFGKDAGPVMARCSYRDGKWGDLDILPFGPILLSPAAKVLHYAQEIFEGMKAYRVNGKGPFIFRPEQNLNRLNLSADRMAMPEIPAEIFMTAVNEVTSLTARYIPRRTGESLYLRPFMIATDPSLGIKPSETYDFYVITGPSGSYFNGEVHGISVLIERQDCRAFPGGTGFAKTGGNYAASLKAAQKVKKMGITQSLWLDAKARKYIEELSGMNFFAVINGELHTPDIGDTVLDGITRKSLIQLASDKGIKTFVRQINIDELIEQIKNGQCTELFACGTAAIITPIACLCEEESGVRYSVKYADGNLSVELKEELLAIQEGRKPDHYNWVHVVEEKNL